MLTHSDTGEYAVLVRSDLKGRGLGWLLMQTLIDYARCEGIRAIQGDVLADNETMLQMCAELGFSVEDDPDDGIPILHVPHHSDGSGGGGGNG